MKNYVVSGAFRQKYVEIMMDCFCESIDDGYLTGYELSRFNVYLSSAESASSVWNSSGMCSLRYVHSVSLPSRRPI
jgi:hypothetical protein